MTFARCLPAPGMTGEGVVSTDSGAPANRHKGEGTKSKPFSNTLAD